MPLKIGCVAAGWRVVLGREAVGDRLVEQSWPPLPRVTTVFSRPPAKQNIVGFFDRHHIVDWAEEDVVRGPPIKLLAPSDAKLFNW